MRSFKKLYTFVLLLTVALISGAFAAPVMDHPSKNGDKPVLTLHDWKWDRLEGWDWYSHAADDQIEHTEKYAFIELEVNVSVELYFLERSVQRTRGRFTLASVVNGRPKLVSLDYVIPYDKSTRRYDIRKIQWGQTPTLSGAHNVDWEYLRDFATSVLDEISNDWRNGEVGQRITWAAAGIGYGIWDAAMGTAYVLVYPEEAIPSTIHAIFNLDETLVVMKEAMDAYFASALSHPQEFALNSGKIGGQLEVAVIGAKLVQPRVDVVKTKIWVKAVNLRIKLHGPNVWKLIKKKQFRVRAQESFTGPVTAELLQDDMYAYQYYADVTTQKSPYLSETLYTPDEARAYLALPDANTALKVRKVIIPKGKIVLRGQVAEKTTDPIFGPHAIGGHEQLYSVDGPDVLIHVDWVR